MVKAASSVPIRQAPLSEGENSEEESEGGAIPRREKNINEPITLCFTVFIKEPLFKISIIDTISITAEVIGA